MTQLRVYDGGRADDRDSGVRWLDQKRGIDPKAEEAVIANVLVDPDLVDEVRPFLKPEHFFSESLRRVYEAACALREAGTVVDIVTVGTWLREHGRLEQVGGSAGLTEMLNLAPGYSVNQAVAYGRSVRDKWVRRQLAEQAALAANRCEHDDAGIERIISETRSSIDQLSQTLVDSEKSMDMKHVLTRAITQMDLAAQSSGRGSRPTGFDAIDKITAGLHSELMLIGARPGMGKTSLATAIAVNRARAGEGAYIASLETTDNELMMRMICAESRVAVHRCRAGTMTPSDWSKITAAAKEFASLPIWVDDTSAMSVAELWARARRIRIQLSREGRKLGIIVVDYIQLLRAPRANMKREEQIAENARALKAMAQELDCPVLALAQLNRESEKRNDHRPQLSDLRESGELEQCARTVMFLYRQDYHQKDPKQMTGLAEVIVAKQNNGPSGTVTLRFLGEFTRFESDGSQPPPADRQYVDDDWRE